MKGKWKGIRAGALVCVMVGVLTIGALSGCSSAEGTSSSDHVLRIAYPSTLTTMDVSSGGDAETMLKEVAGVVETLVNVDSDFNLTPSLATSWERLDDLTWQIDLRENVKFHDGSDFNADAVKWCFDRAGTENSSFASYTSIESTEVVDDHTVKVTTSVPTGELPEALTNVACVIVSPNSVDGDGTFVQPIGTGYFQYKDFDVSAGKFSCTTFDDYWGGAQDSSITERDITSMSDANTRSLAVQNGEIDIASDIPFSDLETLKNSDTVTVEQFDTARTYFYTFNTNKDYLTDVNVRRALLCSINQEDLVDNVLLGVGSVPNGIFMDKVPWNNPDVAKYDYDVEKTKSMLDAVGFVDSDDDGIREYNGEEVTLNIVTGSRRPGNALIVQATQGYFKEIGIDATVQVLEGSALSSAQSDGAYDLYLSSAATGYVPSASYYLNQYYTSGSKNMKYAGFSDPELDALVATCKNMESGAEKNDVSKEAQVYGQDDAVVYTVANYGAVFALNKDITGFTYSAAVHDFIVSYDTDIQ